VLSEGRNIETIIEAATHVPDWQIVFVGEGALSETVRSAAETTENMFWPGAFEHDLMPGFMSQATVGFCLVDIERPIKIVEYGAAGLPVLGAPGKLQQEFSADQLCFVDPKPEAIAEELHQLAAAPDLVERYAEQLRADARENAWSSVADVYQQAINSRLDRSSATNR
jgi:glycosyltransferase involved in cell wall biosynthesis